MPSMDLSIALSVFSESQQNSSVSDKILLASNKTLDWLVPPVQASAKGDAIKYLLSKLRETLKSIRPLRRSKADEGRITDALNGILKGAKNSGNAARKALAHTKQAVITGMVLGSTGVRKLIKGAHKLRMSPVEIMGIIAYIETRRNCPEIQPISGCKVWVDEVQENLIKVYASFVTKAFVGGKLDGSAENAKVTGSNENGALFHLAMLALKHFEYELSNDDSKKIINIEKSFDIQLYNKDGSEFGKEYERKVDIVLEGEEELPHWIEVKSYKSHNGKAIARQFPFWSGNAKGKTKSGKAKKTKGTVHREFYLDSVATQKVSDRSPLAEGFTWYFTSVPLTRKENGLIPPMFVTM